MIDSTDLENFVEKLGNLDQIDTDALPDVRSFSNLLAARLHEKDELSPSQYWQTVQELAEDLQGGTDRYTGQPIVAESEIVGVTSSTFYDLLISQMPFILAKIAPKGFADEFREIYRKR